MPEPTRRAASGPTRRAAPESEHDDHKGPDEVVRPGRARPGHVERLRADYPAWDRILKDFFRPGVGQLVMALVLCLVGMATVTQVHARHGDDTYSGMRRTDLVQLLDQLNSEQARLNDEVTRLQRTRSQLATGADARRVAAAEQAKRLQSLEVLAGTVPAVGPGIRLTLLDPQRKITPELLLDAVEELRDAGAEAIQVNGVRVVTSTWFGGAPGALLVDDQPVDTPLVIDVIGEPHALEGGARFRGGLVSQVEGSAVGGRVAISRLDEVRVTAVHQPTTPQWAKPA